jgi:exonuclease VII small subunit
MCLEDAVAAFNPGQRLSAQMNGFLQQRSAASSDA